MKNLLALGAMLIALTAVSGAADASVVMLIDVPQYSEIIVKLVIGMLQATVEFALKRPEFGDRFRQYLKGLGICD